MQSYEKILLNQIKHHVTGNLINGTSIHDDTFSGDSHTCRIVTSARIRRDSPAALRRLHRKAMSLHVDGTLYMIFSLPFLFYPDIFYSYLIAISIINHPSLIPSMFIIPCRASLHIRGRWQSRFRYGPA